MDEQRRKKLVRTGIAVLGVLTVLLLIAILVISQLPPPTP
jgi:hypothetical protein